MSYPVFASGDVLNAADMNAVGLWLVKTQTVGSAVSSVTVTGAFSADYDNYLITAAGGTMTAGTGISLKLGAAATGYYGVFIYGLYTGGLFNASDNNATVFSYVGGGGTDNYTLNAQLFSPYLTKTTRIAATGVHYVSTFGVYNGVHTTAASYTDFTIAPFSGTMTGGTIRVYGYRN